MWYLNNLWLWLLYIWSFNIFIFVNSIIVIPYYSCITYNERLLLYMHLGSKINWIELNWSILWSQFPIYFLHQKMFHHELNIWWKVVRNVVHLHLQCLSVKMFLTAHLTILALAGLSKQDWFNVLQNPRKLMQEQSLLL
jgi:hypothetical protein